MKKKISVVDKMHGSIKVEDPKLAKEIIDSELFDDKLIFKDIKKESKK